MDLKEIASIIGAELIGENFEVSGMNTLKDASKTEVSFVANSKYIKEIQDTNAGAVIVDKGTLKHVPKGSAALVVDFVYWQMATLSKFFAPAVEATRIQMCITSLTLYAVFTALAYWSERKSISNERNPEI